MICQILRVNMLIKNREQIDTVEQKLKVAFFVVL